MAYITCANDCIHQRDGFCGLDRVPNWHGVIVSGAGCIYCETSSAKNSVNGLSDISNRNQFKA